MTTIIKPQTHKTCKHFYQDEQGQCWCIAHPPQGQVIPTPQGPAPMSFYPPVEQNAQACGEYAPKIMGLN